MFEKKLKTYPLFYRKVWKECLKIPVGETRTYGWIARKIGHPGSARAVGQALAKNPFAPYVPCHRVTRSDGSLGGYSARGGVAQKRKILEKEKVLL
ncbi:MAG: MGMT family protein, partial [Elusimicrobia bacterium]|nr:MGMT family protein [Elusimicrobiota bacterium]